VADERRRGAPLEQADPSLPYRIDWLEAGALADGASGRLGLTFLPGKHGVSGRYPGLVYRRVLTDDLAALRRLGVRWLLLLVEDHELRQWGDPSIGAVAEAAGVTVRRHPLPDGAAPASISEMASLLAELRAARREGDVAVACMGGVGRTGTVAACALVEAGMSAEAAIRHVRRVRHPDAVETAGQRAFVRRYARQRRGSSARAASGGSD
jgi:protein-tyrosine phosphatase